VGINTSTPAATLDVSGQSRTVFNGSTATTTVVSGDGNTIDTLLLMSPTAVSLDLHPTVSIFFGSKTQGNYPYGRIAVRDEQVGGGGFQSSMIFQTSADANSLAERMRINSNGYVGINNSSPVYTLDVTGTIRATGAITASGGIVYTVQTI